jgi:bacterioferritin-associated ferredoxin
VICHCEAVSDRTVDAALASGARSVDEVTARCRAGGGCGGCHRALEALIEARVGAALVGAGAPAA